MRHNKKFNHLSRTSAHRKSMLANMAISLIRYKRITTTLAKAKALRVYVEPLLTKSKEDTTNSRRVVFSYLQNKDAITELFQNISQKIADRPGGYTRILRTGLRMGDNAEMCIIELVDYNENMLKEKAVKKVARTRRSSAKKTGDASATSATMEKVVTDKPTETTEDKTVVDSPEKSEKQEEAVKETVAETAEKPAKDVKVEPKKETSKTAKTDKPVEKDVEVPVEKAKTPADKKAKETPAAEEEAPGKDKE